MEQKLVKLLDMCHFQEIGDNVNFLCVITGAMKQIFQQMGQMCLYKVTSEEILCNQ